LSDYDILDTPAETEFDDIVRLAAEACEAPIAVVNLIDAKRQWFKAEIGLGVRETPLDVSICAHAILQPGLFVVPDTTKDPRFAGNPLVTGEPRLRFYAGALLETAGGLPLGTLCVLDHKPRELTERQAFTLKALARLTMTQLELRRTLRLNRESEARRRLILESATDYAIITLDPKGRITSWNEGARRILGWTEEEACREPTPMFFTPEDRKKGVPQAEMRSALAAGRALDERWHVRKDGTRFWASGELMPLRTERDGKPQGFLKILRDRTEQRRSEEALAKSEAERRETADALAAQVAAEGERLRRLFDQAPSFMAVLREPAHIFEFANSAYLRLVGGRDIVGKPVREALPEVQGQGFIELLDRVYASGEPFIGRAVKVALQPGPGRPVEERYLDFVYQPIADPDGRSTGIFVDGSDVTDRVRAEERQAALIELGDRLRDLRDAAEIAGAAAEIMGRTLRVARAGYGRVDPSEEYVIVERDWTNGLVASIAGLHRFRNYGSGLGESLKRGETLAIADVGQDARTADGAARLGAIDVRSLVNVPLVEHGRLSAILYIHHDEPRPWSREDLAFVRDVADRTWAAAERARAEEQQRLLTAELQHRIKNTLAMVQAIATQTLRNAETKEEAAEAFGGRLQALARGHDLLTQASWDATPIRAVVEGALAPHRPTGTDRIRAGGPDLQLDAKAALALALALHELATNAVKYGALSNDSGEVEATWAVDVTGGAPILRFRWQERGGPPVRSPTRRGFGSRLLERGLAGQLGGEMKLAYEPSGLVCTLEAPLGGTSSV
jgi:PAS domain S-box-containing protein